MNPPRFSLIFYKDFLRFLRAAHPIQYAQRIQFLRAAYYANHYAQRTPQRLNPPPTSPAPPNRLQRYNTEPRLSI